MHNWRAIRKTETRGGGALRMIGSVIALSALVVGLSLGRANAQDVKTYTRATFDEWLQKYKDTKPDFKPGDVLTAKDMERMRPFIPPGYLEQLSFPEFQAKIIPAADHRPRKDYVECSEKYQNQTKLNADGSMANYVCGQPFPNSDLKVGDPQSGIKAAWNFEFRWQNFGFFCVPPATWDRFGGTHVIPTWEPPPLDWLEGVLGFKWEAPSGDEMKMIYGGGGNFQRSLFCLYRKLIHSHLPMFAPTHNIPAPDAATYEWKEFTGFFGPFDIRGTAFIIYRYNDPFRADDAWAYIPNLRRVRRISAEVKSDSLLGTDHTLEDFYGFAGRPLEWKWKFLGMKDALCVMDSAHDYTYLYGPNGIVPNDSWSVRHFVVMERISKDPRHPYSSVVDFWDPEIWDTFWMQSWDRKGKLWKTWEFQKEWTEDFKVPYLAAINNGVRTSNFQSVQVLDTQNDRGTIWITPGGYPNVDMGKATALYDINKLEQIHR